MVEDYIEKSLEGPQDGMSTVDDIRIKSELCESIMNDYGEDPSVEKDCSSRSCSDVCPMVELDGSFLKGMEIIESALKGD